MSDNAGNRPTDGRVCGREGVSADEKAARATAGERSFSSRGVFEDFGIGECSEGGLSGEDSGFALLIITLDVP